MTLEKVNNILSGKGLRLDKNSKDVYQLIDLGTYRVAMEDEDYQKVLNHLKSISALTE